MATPNNEAWREQQRGAPRKDGGWASMQESRVPRFNAAGEPPRRMQEWHHTWATEALRVLKPGGHLLTFGGTRTYHRLACAVEDAGFEIRDSLIWLYGSGFPKSLDVSKAIDKAEGTDTSADERWRPEPHFVTGDYKTASGNSQQIGQAKPGLRHVYEPATSEAQQWQGWGTALKPAHEPIVVARKPLIGTVAANVLEHGTGALNVDGCRVGMSETDREAARVPQRDHHGYSELGKGEGRSGERFEPQAAGRWPANVALSPEAAAELDRQSGEGGGGERRAARPGAKPFTDERGWNAHSMTRDGATAPENYGDTGGASRFFYTAKASRAERNAGLDGFAERRGGGLAGTHDQSMLTGSGNERNPFAQNHHPTVKPIDLMRWLVRLVTPPGGTVLDPFLGSGTTGIAAALEDFDFIGIEREAEYVEIAEARIAWWAQFAGRDTAEILQAAGLAERERQAHVGQTSLDFEAA